MTTAEAAGHDPTRDTVTLERDGHVLVMGLNRSEKRNAFNVAMLADLARACALLEGDDDLRAGVLIAHGEHFTAGLDLVDVAPYLTEGRDPMPRSPIGRHRWGNGRRWRRRSRPSPRACSPSSSAGPPRFVVGDA
jgi:enoyl-CoA hydratase/carnithine racemase